MYKLKDIFSLNLNTRGGVKLFNKIANKYNLNKEDRKDLMNVEVGSEQNSCIEEDDSYYLMHENNGELCENFQNYPIFDYLYPVWIMLLWNSGNKLVPANTGIFYNMGYNVAQYVSAIIIPKKINGHDGFLMYVASISSYVQSLEDFRALDKMIEVVTKLLSENKELTTINYVEEVNKITGNHKIKICTKKECYEKNNVYDAELTL